MTVALNKIVGLRFVSTRLESARPPVEVSVSEMLQAGWGGKLSEALKLCGEKEAVQSKKEYWETLTAFAELAVRVQTPDATKLPVTIEIELRD